MSWESPIHIFEQQLKSKLENEILTAVRRVHVEVDKDELIRALQYDRQQYEKGYRDAKAEIVHCEECINWRRFPDVLSKYGHCHWYACTKLETGYCDRGERRSEDDG